MRNLLTFVLVSVTMAGPAFAQQSTTVTTIITTPADDVPVTRATPQANVFVADKAASDATAGPDGVIRQIGPQQPVVQGAAAPAASYPPCTHGRTDSCTNPDLRRELPYFPADHG